MLKIFLAVLGVVNLALFAAMARSCFTYFLWEREQQRKVSIQEIPMTEKTDIEILNDQLYAAFGGAMSKPMDWGRFPPIADDPTLVDIDVTYVVSEYEL